MFEIPIKSIKQAEEYFKAMGCLHFHMAREFPQRYEEYKELNITKQQEKEWVAEQFEEYYDSIMQDKSDTILWNVHSRMAELLGQLRIESTLTKMLEVTQYIRGKIPSRDGVIVSETINGRGMRRLRGGLIYLSYDLNNIQIAKIFAELSLYFANFKEEKNIDSERCQRATELCNSIKAELGI